MAEWSEYTTEQSRLQARLIDRGVTILTHLALVGQGAGTAEFACVHTGKPQGIACGTLIPVTSREPQDGLWHGLQGRGLATLERIGDARAPGLIAHAVHDGHRAGRALFAPPEGVLRREVIAL